LNILKILVRFSRTANSPHLDVNVVGMKNSVSAALPLIMWLNNTWPLIGRPGKQLILLVFYSETAIYFSNWMLVCKDVSDWARTAIGERPMRSLREGAI